MSYQPLEQMLPKTKYSIYKLIRLAAIRATELAEGKPRLLEKPSSQKVATIALEEIREGLVHMPGYVPSATEKVYDAKYDKE